MGVVAREPIRSLFFHFGILGGLSAITMGMLCVAGTGTHLLIEGESISFASPDPLHSAQGSIPVSGSQNVHDRHASVE